MKTENSPKKGECVNVIIYCRVSAPIQSQGASIESQIEYCYEYCNKRGWRIEKVFIDEDVLNHSTNCKQLKDVLSYCTTHQSRISALVVYSFDRISRDEQDYFTLHNQLSELDILIISVTQPPEGSPEEKFIRIMLEALHKFKSIPTRMRLEATKQRLQSKGQLSGHAPIGYIKTKNSNNDFDLIVDPERGHLVSEAFKMFSTGGYSVKDVCNHINRLGFKSRVNSKPMTIERLTGVLKNQIYVGDVFMHNNVEYVRSTYKPLVRRTVFKVVQDILTHREKLFGKEYQQSRVPCSNKNITCSKCGKPKTVSLTVLKRNKRYFRYTCTNKNCSIGCKHRLAVKLKAGLRERHPLNFQFG